MTPPSRTWRAALCLAAATIACFTTPVAAGGPPAPRSQIKTIDLSGPFATRSAWRLTATRAPPIDDPVGQSGEEPGAIDLCLRRSASEPCDPQLQRTVGAASDNDVYASPHFLRDAEVVHGAAGRPLLLVQTASIYSGDGDQLVFTQVLAYDHAADRFLRAYGRLTGKNNNQEVRFIRTGPLTGDVISAEPTQNAPFGFWISVNKLGGALRYEEVLRFRSATRYGDGNPLSVIDSEMPNIQSRLGLWRPGSPTPLPASVCPAPRLIRMELWCR